MSNSRRMALFLGSFFVTILFIILMSTVIRPVVQDSSSDIANFVITPIYLSLAFYFFVFFYAFARKMFFKKYILENAVLLTIKADKITVTDRLWYYLFIVLIHFYPIYKGIFYGTIVIAPILSFIVFTILSEFILKSSIKTVRINFLRTGVVVTGFDTRFNIPMEGLGTEVRNDYGFYHYDDIENYFPFEDRLELFLHAERGKLVIKADSETLRQVTGIIFQQKIEKRKFL